MEVTAFEAVPERREVRLKVDARIARAGLIRELAVLVKDFPGEAPVYRRARHVRRPEDVHVRAGVPGLAGAGLLRRGQGAARRGSCPLTSCIAARPEASQLLRALTE